MHNHLNYTPGDYVLNSFVMMQQLNILSSAFHIETEVPVSSTSIPSTSIQDVLKLQFRIKRKTKRQYKKTNNGIFTSDEILEINEKKDKDKKINRKKKKIREKRKKDGKIENKITVNLLLK